MDAMPHGPEKNAPRRRYTPLRYRAAAPTAWRAPVATVGRRHPGHDVAQHASTQEAMRDTV